jgi:hypothetical protein
VLAELPLAQPLQRFVVDNPTYTLSIHFAAFGVFVFEGGQRLTPGLISRRTSTGLAFAPLFSLGFGRLGYRMRRPIGVMAGAAPGKLDRII